MCENSVKKIWLRKSFLAAFSRIDIRRYIDKSETVPFSSVECFVKSLFVQKLLRSQILKLKMSWQSSPLNISFVDMFLDVVWEVQSIV